MQRWISDFFKLEQNNSSIRTEFIAGFTTFLAMAYITVVNPAILSKTGMDFGAVINYSGSVDGNISSGTATSNACGTTPVTFNASFSASSNTSPSFIDQRDPVRQERTCPLNAGQLITPIFTLLLTN